MSGELAHNAPWGARSIPEEEGILQSPACSAAIVITRGGALLLYPQLLALARLGCAFCHRIGARITRLRGVWLARTAALRSEFMLATLLHVCLGTLCCHLAASPICACGAAG